MASGKGKFYHSHGDSYNGDWKRNMMHGFGKFNNANGSWYEGEWKDDLQHGFGNEVWIDDEAKYSGMYYKGIK